MSELVISASAILARYVSLFPGNSREKTRFMQLAEAVLIQVADLQVLIDSMKEAYSLENAVGTQLDQFAGSLGLSRLDTTDGVSCSDEDFRKFISMKLALWRWNGTNDGISSALTEMPWSFEVDNMNGTVSLTNVGSLPAPASSVFPIPAGIAIAT